ncbi:MAG: ABC transporter ATP-binding protein [Bacteroidetes bacterium]|nr:MAG: ABC transporter ATP-binding protein [Bacteroidota bacterium]
MIQLREIQKIYRTKTVETIALENVNLEIGRGEFVSVMGPSGCGKSTLLNIIGLLDKPSQGELSFQEKNTRNFSDKEAARLRNQNIGFIFQSFHLINALNVFDNVGMPLLYSRMSSSERKSRTRDVLETVGLSHRMRHFPAELSGGQSQRVAIARAIVAKPSLLLADEPTGNLDSKNGEQIMEMLKDLNKNHQTTVVMVTHDEQLARQTQRIIRFFDGRQVS